MNPNKKYGTNYLSDPALVVQSQIGLGETFHYSGSALL